MHKLFALSFRRIAARLGQQELTALTVASALQSSKIPPSGEGFLYRLPREELKHITNIPCPINSIEDSSSQIIIQSSKRLRHHAKINEEKTCAKCPFKSKCPCAKQPYTGQLDNTPKDLLIFWSGLSTLVKTEDIYFRQWTSAYKLGDSIIASLNDLAEGGKQIEEYEKTRVESTKKYQQIKQKQLLQKPQKETKEKQIDDLNEKYKDKVIQKLRTKEVQNKQTSGQQQEIPSGFGRDFSFDQGEQFQAQVGFTKDNFKEQQPKKENKSLKNQKGYQTIENKQDTRENKYNRDTREYKDNRYSKDNRENRYSKDNRENGYNKDYRENRYNKDNRDYKDNRDNKPNYKPNFQSRTYQNKYPVGETKADTNYIQRDSKPLDDSIYDKKSFATPKRTYDNDFQRQVRFDDKRFNAKDDRRFVPRDSQNAKQEKSKKYPDPRPNNRDFERQTYDKKNYSNNYERNSDRRERFDKYDNPKRNTQNRQYSQNRQLNERKSYRHDQNDQKPKPFIEKWNPETPQSKEYPVKKQFNQNGATNAYPDSDAKSVKKTPAPKIIQVQQAGQQAGTRRVGRTIRRRGSSTNSDETPK